MVADRIGHENRRLALSRKPHQSVLWSYAFYTLFEACALYIIFGRRSSVIYKCGNQCTANRKLCQMDVVLRSTNGTMYTASDKDQEVFDKPARTVQNSYKSLLNATLMVVTRTFDRICVNVHPLPTLSTIIAHATSSVSCNIQHLNHNFHITFNFAETLIMHVTRLKHYNILQVAMTC